MPARDYDAVEEKLRDVERAISGGRFSGELTAAGVTLMDRTERIMARAFDARVRLAAVVSRVCNSAGPEKRPPGPEPATDTLEDRLMVVETRVDDLVSLAIALEAKI